MVNPYLSCMVMVSSFHHLPSGVLSSIQKVEGGYPGAVRQNTNGTQDLGVMQINTRWVTPLVHVTHQPGTKIYERLRDDSCYNIAVAGAIMKLYLQETHGDIMQAIGNYHSHTPYLNIRYQMQVLNAAYQNNHYQPSPIAISYAGALSPYQRRLKKMHGKKIRQSCLIKNRCLAKKRS